MNEIIKRHDHNFGDLGQILKFLIRNNNRNIAQYLSKFRRKELNKSFENTCC
jgi:hypothetical protein